MRHARDFQRSWTIPEEMIGSAVPAVRSPRVIPVKLLETGRKSLLGGAQRDVMVIRHQTPREDLPFELRRDHVELSAE
ncbi:MAG: hypothetical protein ABI990_12750 [Actinomycetota bacterium]